MEIFDYDNILLLPRKCRVESRSECDAGVTLGSRTFRLPVVPANMKTVVDETICLWMAQNNYFYVMHRFDLDNVQFVRDMHGKGVYASISLGVKAPDRATVDQLAAEGLVPLARVIEPARTMNWSPSMPWHSSITSWVPSYLTTLAGFSFGNRIGPGCSLAALATSVIWKLRAGKDPAGTGWPPRDVADLASTSSSAAPAATAPDCEGQRCSARYHRRSPRARRAWPAERP